MDNLTCDLRPSGLLNPEVEGPAVEPASSFGFFLAVWDNAANAASFASSILCCSCSCICIYRKEQQMGDFMKGKNPNEEEEEEKEWKLFLVTEKWRGQHWTCLFCLALLHHMIRILRPIATLQYEKRQNNGSKKLDENSRQSRRCLPFGLCYWPPSPPPRAASSPLRPILRWNWAAVSRPVQLCNEHVPGNRNFKFQNRKKHHKKSINQSLTWWFNDSINQSINHSKIQTVAQSINQSFEDPISRPINQSINRSVAQWINLEGMTHPNAFRPMLRDHVQALTAISEPRLDSMRNQGQYVGGNVLL